jgi:Tol biopolymer transport system component
MSDDVLTPAKPESTPRKKSIILPLFLIIIGIVVGIVATFAYLLHIGSKWSAPQKVASIVPSGRAYFVSSQNGRRQLNTAKYDGSDKHLVLPETIGGEQYDLSVSPNDKYLAYLSTENAKTDESGQDIPDLTLSNADGSGGQIISSEKSIGEITWSPDGTYLAWTETVDSIARLSVYNLQSKKTTHFHSDEGDVGSFDFSNDSKYLAIAIQQSNGCGEGGCDSESSSIWQADGDGSNPIKIVPTQSYEQTSPNFLSSNDIEFNNAGTTYIYSITTKKITNTHTSFYANTTNHNPVLSPDKNRVAYTVYDAGKTLLYVSKPDGSEAIGLLVYETSLSNLHWTQDSQFIQFSALNYLYVSPIDPNLMPSSGLESFTH